VAAPAAAVLANPGSWGAHEIFLVTAGTLMVVLALGVCWQNSVWEAATESQFSRLPEATYKYDR
jgi:hypothetical protein